MRKGIASQIFIYIFVAIVIALIIFFGFKQVVNIKNLQEKSNYVVFKSEFENAVDDLYYKNPGSMIFFSSTSRNKPLVLPKGVDQVCFDTLGNVNLNSFEYATFNVEHLRGGEECIDVVRGGLSFKLENQPDEANTENTIVIISPI
tara:strand:- start:940 stop:1377 length:438 start_codon:yes stop_codon:yes gene_type:complete